MSGKSNIQYAYLLTLIGVIVAGASMIYTGIRSLLFAGFRPHHFMNGGNFTANQFGNFTARQFGNFTGNFNGPPRFAYNPYGGIVSYLMIITSIIAIVGAIWLGISLASKQ